MDEGMGRFDDDEDAAVVAVAEPIERHEPGSSVATPRSVPCKRRCGWACDLLWRRLGAMGNASPLSVDKVALAKGSLL